MALTLPSSIQELVGRRILSISTSFPERDVIVFDTNATADNQRTRYAYSVTGTFDRAWRLSSMVGYTVTEIAPLTQEPSGQQQMVIKTDGSYGVGILYFSILGAEGLLTEGGDDWVQEGSDSCPCLLEELGTDLDVELEDISVGRSPPFSGSQQYIVQEDDIDYTASAITSCPCEE